MANKIQIKRGNKDDMPTLSVGEPAFAVDTKEVYIGTETGNLSLTGTRWFIGGGITGTLYDTLYVDAACPEMKVGDIYLCKYYGYFYKCVVAGKGTDAKWQFVGILKGSTGASGKDKQAVYSSTPTQIGDWTDGTDIMRAAWTFTASNVNLSGFASIPSNPVTEEKNVLRCTFSCKYNGYSHIAESLDGLKSILSDSSSTGETVYCVIEYM